MRLKAIPATLLSLLLTLVACSLNARADDDTEPEYEVTARVARISLIKGDVNIRRQGNTEWEKAKLNLPLVEGDTLATDGEGRLEIQIDARNFARIGSDSVLTIVTLRNEGIALSLSRGTATIRLARFDRDREYFEIDAPKTTVAAEKTGLYRLDVDQNGRVQITVRDNGRARIYSQTAGFLVRDGHSATLVYQGDEEGDWQFAEALAKDGWDDWVTTREAYLATRLRYDDRIRYYDSDVWGAEELDAYGNWSYVNDYGWIWRPHITVINNYNNWAPYRYGDWVWCPPYGWTWVGQEPWGWAPYHYGRWVYYNNYWAWCPRSFDQRRSWWRPALVAFVSLDFNFGTNYCWYPLSYHQRDPRSRHYGRDHSRNMRPGERDRWHRPDPNYYHGVTSQSARDFGSHRGRNHPLDSDLARRAIGADPFSGDFPVRPAGNFGRNNPGDRQARGALGRTPADAALAGRPTGAAFRRPGVPLDEELRRSRIWNGRDPISTSGTGGGLSGVTGAVMRPARPVRQPGVREKENDPLVSTPVERAAQPMRKPGVREKENDGNPIDSPPVERAAQPVRKPGVREKENDGNPVDSAPVERPARPVRQPGVREKENDGNPVDSAPVERPARPAREPGVRIKENDGNPGESPTAPRRSEPPAPRYEPPARNDPPPQRSEPPARSDPPPRSEPAPQRSEPAKPAEERPSRAEQKRDNR